MKLAGDLIRSRLESTEVISEDSREWKVEKMRESSSPQSCSLGWIFPHLRTDCTRDDVRVVWFAPRNIQRQNNIHVSAKRLFSAAKRVPPSMGSSLKLEGSPTRNVRLYCRHEMNVEDSFVKEVQEKRVEYHSMPHL